MSVVADDPTVDFLDRLADESQWVIIRNAPIFKPHVRYVLDEDTKKLRRIEVTENDLPAIVAKMQRLEDEEGVVQRITPGHVKPAAPETEQPPIYGFGRNPRLGTYGPLHKPAIVADLYYRPEHYDDAKTYPFRSAEYYDGRKEIRGIALLKRDPFLDMGMVTYTAARPCYLYAFSESAVPDEAKPAEKPTESNSGEPEAPKGHDEFLGHMAHYAKSNPWVSYAMKCYELNNPGPSSAEAGNDSVPGDGKKTEEKPVPNQNDQAAVLYQQAQADNKALSDRLKALEADNAAQRQRADRAECRQMLAPLVAVGYQMDVAVETETLANTPADKRAARVEYVRKHYKQDESKAVLYAADSFIPLGDAPTVQADPAKRPATADEVGAAVAYHQTHPAVSYESALLLAKKGELK